MVIKRSMGAGFAGIENPLRMSLRLTGRRLSCGVLQRGF
jgi:hypothetical protein